MMTRRLSIAAVVGLVACSMIASPPQDLVVKNDHVALAAWYENEAARLRHRAAELTEMAEEYRRDPGRGIPDGHVHAPKVDFALECRNLAGAYTNAAEKAEALARAHRGQLR